eukprot:m.359975 g.359975  ORF g.359975 m.359975 type:complete len:134 (-) comp18845_c0_seq1:355-756(-)
MEHVPLWAKRSGYRGTDKHTVSSFSSETGRPKHTVKGIQASKVHYPPPEGPQDARYPKPNTFVNATNPPSKPTKKPADPSTVQHTVEKTTSKEIGTHLPVSQPIALEPSSEKKLTQYSRSDGAQTFKSTLGFG